MSEHAANLICLDKFLKASALVETGGRAKILIQAGEVLVNNQVETRRRRKLVATDVVTIEGQSFHVSDLIGTLSQDDIDETV